MSRVVLGGSPVILSLNANRALTWTSSYTNGIVIIEKSTNLQTGSWSPFYYDVATNAMRTTLLPAASDQAAFYRLAIQTNAPDASLVMHLSFDNDLSMGKVLDVSGHGNDGLRYGRPCCPTNWPHATLGPDGSQAGEFHFYRDGYGEYGTSGDYMAILSSPTLNNLTQATISAWAWYYATPSGQVAENQTGNIMDAGQYESGAWLLGRLYSPFTVFQVATNDLNSVTAVNFPDTTLTGDSGGWNHYVITFDGGTVKGYYNGSLISSIPQIGVGNLSVAGSYIGVSCWTFDETPAMDLSVDQHPNNAWMWGAMDDLRIYNRVLTATEISALYYSFDKTQPSIPQNLQARADASSQVELRWNLSGGSFGVAGYRVRRNGAVVGTAVGPCYADTGLSAQTTYTYTIEAYDGALHYSGQSAAVPVTTPPVGSTIDVIVDVADTPGWVSMQGTWDIHYDVPGYWGAYFLGGTDVSGATNITFTPTLPESGNYGVYVWNPGAASFPMYEFAGNVPVVIVHGGATNTVVLNEQANYAQWNYLGTFSFSAGTNGFVQIGTAGTGSWFVSADAVQFVK
jgi:hypothetical protein